MKTYTFNVALQGEGETEEEAWTDATEAFTQDPGEPHSCTEEGKTTKVVINNCHGGFGISKECAEFMAAEGSKDAQFMLDEHKRSTTRGEWYERLCQLGVDINGDVTYDKYPRHCPLLVRAVETLGTENASAWAARLIVVEIKGDTYIIEEYDGAENITTPDNIDWVRV